jgi:16S rRNA processing protein RimM
MNELKKVGIIKKAHSYKGYVLVEWIYNSLEISEEIEYLFLIIDKKPVPFYVEDHFMKGHRYAVKFADVDDEISARNIIGYEVSLLAEDIIFFEEDMANELLGFSVIDINLGFLGKIEDIMQITGNELAMIAYKGKEVFLPLNEDLIESIDKEKKELNYNMPEGLLDL